LCGIFGNLFFQLVYENTQEVGVITFIATSKNVNLFPQNKKIYHKLMLHLQNANLDS